MSRMQRTGQRSCADVSALRCAGHRHHQTAAKGGIYGFGYSVSFRCCDYHMALDFYSSHEQSDIGSAQKHSATTTITLVSRPPSSRPSPHGEGGSFAIPLKIRAT